MSVLLDSFWTRFGQWWKSLDTFSQVSIMCPMLSISLDALWTPKQTWTLFGHFLDTLWTYFVHILDLDTFWIHFGHILDTSWNNVSKMCPSRHRWPVPVSWPARRRLRNSAYVSGVEAAIQTFPIAVVVVGPKLHWQRRRRRRRGAQQWRAANSYPRPRRECDTLNFVWRLGTK